MHFAGLDHDYESGLDHAQYREYSSAQAHWMSPDPYSGSYDWSNPQSLNRYSYALNNPLSLTDPSGQFTNGAVTATGCASFGPIGCVIGAGIDLGLGVALEDIFGGLFGGPSFHGSLKPRPNAQPWDEYNIHYGPNIAGALGLPDDTCEFGGCGGGMGFLKQTPINENTALSEKIKQLAALGIALGPLETKYSPFHKNQLTFRDNRSFCSTHVVIDKNSGVNGRPVTGSLHKDLFSPWAEPENPFFHTILDLIPDEIQQVYPSFPTGSDLCN